VDEAAFSKAAGPPQPDRPSSEAQESAEIEKNDQKTRGGKGGSKARGGGGNAIQAAVRQVTLLSLQYLNADHNLISQVPGYQYCSYLHLQAAIRTWKSNLSNLLVQMYT
jgi:hypothetical protein